MRHAPKLPGEPSGQIGTSNCAPETAPARRAGVAGAATFPLLWGLLVKGFPDARLGAYRLEYGRRSIAATMIAAKTTERMNPARSE